MQIVPKSNCPQTPGEVWIEVYGWGIQNLTLFKAKTIHSLSPLFKTRELFHDPD